MRVIQQSIAGGLSTRLPAPRRRAGRVLWAAAALLWCAALQAQTTDAASTAAPTAAPQASPIASPAATPASAPGPGTGRGGPPGAIPAEHFFQHPRLITAKLSPSGRRVLVTQGSASGHIGLRVVDLAPNPRFGPVMQFSGLDVVNAAWTSDERLVFQLRDLQQGSGADRYTGPGLFTALADGSGARVLIEQGYQRVIEGPSGQRRALRGDHLLLHVPTPQPGVPADRVVIGQLQGQGKELMSVLPMWLDAASGATQGMDLGRVPDGAVRWWFDSQGQARVLATRQAGRAALYRRKGSDAEWQRIAEAGLLDLPFEPVAVDDAGTLFVRVRTGAAGLAALAVFDEDKQSPKLPPLVSVPGFDFQGEMLPGAPGQGAAGVRVDGETEEAVWFADASQRAQALADARWPGHVNRVSCVRCGEPGMVALVHSFSDRDPGRLTVYDATAKRWLPLGPVQEQIDPRRMAGVEFKRLRARDGRDLPVWLTLPEGVAPGKPAPAVVLVHGGPWVRGGQWRWDAMAQFLASRGYLVINPEFRGSAGYGAAHAEAGWKQWGQAMQNDVADALLWARQEGLADGRACIAGASYGGYSTLMGLARHPELYRCGAAWVAVTDLPLFLAGAWWVADDLDETGRQHVLPKLVGDVQADAAMLRDNSPVNLAAHIKAPLLLAMGEADRRVPLAHGQRLRDALADAGNPPQWVSYPTEGHSWRKTETRVDFARRLEAFLAQHLAGPAARP